MPRGRQALDLGCLPFHHLAKVGGHVWNVPPATPHVENVRLEEPTRFLISERVAYPFALSIRVSGHAAELAGSTAARMGFDPIWPA